MRYTIDINNDYYLEVEKRHDTSFLDDEPYVVVVVSINHKKYSYYQFKPIILVECVYEKRLISKLFGQPWSKRVNRNEVKLIEKAKRYINKLPNLEESMLKQFS